MSHNLDNVHVPGEGGEEEEAFSVETVFPDEIFKTIAKDTSDPNLVAHHSKYAFFLFIDVFTQEHFEGMLDFMAQTGATQIINEVNRDLNLLTNGKYDPFCFVKDYVFRRTHVLLRVYFTVLAQTPRTDPNFSNMRLDCMDGIFWICHLIGSAKRKFIPFALECSIKIMASMIENGAWAASNEWTSEVQAYADLDEEENLDCVLKESKHVLEATPVMLGLLLSNEFAGDLAAHDCQISPQSLDQLLKMCSRLMHKLAQYPAVDNGRDYDIFFWMDFFTANGRLSSFAPETLRREFVPYFMERARAFSKGVLRYTKEQGRSIELVTSSENREKNIELLYEATERGKVKNIFLDHDEPHKVHFFHVPDRDSHVPALQEKSNELRSWLPLGDILLYAVPDVLKVASKEEVDELFDNLFPQPVIDALLSEKCFIRTTFRSLAAALMILGFFAGKKNDDESFPTFDAVAEKIEKAFETNSVPSLEISGDVSIIFGIQECIPRKSYEEGVEYMQKTFLNSNKNPAKPHPNQRALSELRPEVIDLFFKLLARLMSSRPSFLEKAIVDTTDSRSSKKKEDDDGAGSDDSDDDDSKDPEEQKKKAFKRLGFLVDAVTSSPNDKSKSAEPFNKSLGDARTTWIHQLVPCLDRVAGFILGPHATESTRASALHVLVPVTNWLAGGRTPFAVERRLIFAFGDFIKTADAISPLTHEFALPTLQAIEQMITNFTDEYSHHCASMLQKRKELEAKNQFNMLQAGVKLAAENDALDHFYYASVQSIYCAGVWLRKLEEEMFQCNPSLKKECLKKKKKNGSSSSSPSGETIIQSCIDRCIMDGYRSINLAAVLQRDFDDVLIKTYPETGVTVLPQVKDQDMSVLVIHAFLRILQCFASTMGKSFVAFTPEEQHNFGPHPIKVHSFYRVLMFCCDGLLKYLETPPENALARNLLIPAVERTVHVLGAFQDKVLIEGSLLSEEKGTKNNNDDDDDDEDVPVEVKNDPYQDFDHVKKCLAESIYDSLKLVNDKLLSTTAWQFPQTGVYVKQFLEMAKKQVPEKEEKAENPWGAAPSSSSDASGPKKRKKKKGKGQVEIPPSDQQEQKDCKQQ